MTEENKQELKPCPVLSDANNGLEISYVVKACIDCDLRKPGVGEDTINSCRGCESREKRVDKLVAEAERLKGDHAELWAEPNGYQISAENVLAERDNYKRLLTVALNTFKLQIDGNRTNRKSIAIIAYESINDQLEEK
jgi:hypothetical protein